MLHDVTAEKASLCAQGRATLSILHVGFAAKLRIHTLRGQAE